VEHLLRVISWTVVLGAVFALAYAGFKPVFQELGFPPVDENQVRGSMVNPEARAEMDSAKAVAQNGCEAAGDDAGCSNPKPNPKP